MSSPSRTQRLVNVRSSVGVEVDGSRVTLVQVVDGVVVATRLVDEPTSARSLTKALENLPPGVPVTVTVAGEAQVSARVTSAVCPETRDQLRAVVDRHVRVAPDSDRALLSAGVTSAAAFRAPSGPGRQWTGLVVGMPQALVTSTYVAAGAGAAPYLVRVVPSALTCAVGGSLVLALRGTDSELTLSHDGIPTATCQLAVGGLGVVEAALGSGDEVGSARAEEALRHGGVRDPMAGSELDRWLRGALEQALTAIARWRAQGMVVPDEIFIHGRAGRAVALDLLLSDYRLKRAVTPPRMAAGLLKVVERDRPHVIGAYMAAVAGGAGDLAAFDNPDETAALARAASRLARRRRVITASVVGALLLGASAGPAGAVSAMQWWQGQQIEAMSAQVVMEAGLPSAAAAKDLAGALATEGSGDGGVDIGLLSDAITGLPQGARVVSVASHEAGSVELSVEVAGAAGPSSVGQALRTAGFEVTALRLVPATSSSPASFTAKVSR